MKIDLSQQVSSTYARNHFKEVMTQVREEGMKMIIHKSKPAMVIMTLDNLEKIITPKQNKKRKFSMAEIKKDKTFDKYKGCVDKVYGDMDSVKLCKKWAEYVD